jgi:hypothetical protein
LTLSPKQDSPAISSVDDYLNWLFDNQRSDGEWFKYSWFDWRPNIVDRMKWSEYTYKDYN